MVFWDQGICGVATVSTQKRHKAGDFGRCAGAAVRAIEERHEKLGRKPEQNPRLDARINQGLMQGKIQKKNPLVPQQLLAFPVACSHSTHEKSLQRGANPNMVPYK